MASNLLIGGVLLGGAFLLWRRSASSPAGGGGSACDAICDAAAKQGLPVDACKQGAAYRLCKGFGDLLMGWDDKDAANKQLNGAVDLPLGPLGDRTVTIGAGELAELGQPGNANAAALRPSSALQGSVARFKNGCVPFAGMPGFEKCAAGTYNMETAGDHLTIDPSSGKFTQTKPAAAFSGDAGDPFTGGPFTSSRTFSRPPVVGGGSAQQVSEPAFPLPLAQGETGYFYKGQPFKCPAGTSPQWNVHDQRTGGGPPPCAKPDGSGGWVSSGPQNANGAQPNAGTHQNIGCPIPAGYTWDAGGFLRRLKAGETQNQGPCAQPLPASSGRGGLAAAASSVGSLISTAGGSGSRT